MISRVMKLQILNVSNSMKGNYILESTSSLRLQSSSAGNRKQCLLTSNIEYSGGERMPDRLISSPMLGAYVRQTT